MKTYFGSTLPDNISEVIMQTNMLCCANLQKMYTSYPVKPTAPYVKRVLHWESLAIVIEHYYKNPRLAEQICLKFKSPKKWVLTTEDFYDSYTGYCEYANFGKLVVEGCVRFIDYNVNKTSFG